MTKRKKITTIELAPGVVISLGDLVRYYKKGWRYGYVDSFENKSTVKILPVGKYKVNNPRCVKVPITEIEGQAK